MGKKQQKLLRTRYMTDVVSRWKYGESTNMINWKLNEYRHVSQISEEEYDAFIKVFHDTIYDILVSDYKEEYQRDRATLAELLHRANEDVEYPHLKRRLMAQIKEWIEAENESIYTTIVNKYLTLLTYGWMVDELYDRVPHDTNRQSVQQRLLDLLAGWERTMREAERPANELERMAQDAQNIHTLVVSRQTNDMLAILATVVVPPGQQTMKEINQEWYEILTGVSWNQALTVEYDIRTWAKKSYIVNPGDFLYRKTLRSVWAKIQTYPTDIRTELIRRLWEECWEAVGMCAQGHISRLINVFAGFDDSVVAEESFQDKMSAISRMDLSTDAKITEATRIMDSLQMDTAERRPWLESF